MTVPFRLDPEPPKRPTQQDPFLEFASERADSDRPSKALLGSQDASRLSQDDSGEPLDKPGSDRLVTDLASLDRLSSDRREPSAINPTIAFAVGVAGLVTAAVGYYQMGQLLADRSKPPVQNAQTATDPALPAAPVAPAPPAVGRLEIASDPAGARVTVNGAALGVTPLILANVKPGRQEIVMTRGASTVTRTVELTAGGIATVTAVLVTAPPPASTARAGAANAAPASAIAGWVTFESPIELRILDRGRARGSTRDRLSLAEGTHELELVSDIYEVRQSLSARVGAGRGTRITVPVPSGSLSINALPWADVWVDGSPVGTTPLANLTVKVGPHQVLLRHPTLGERQQTVIVKAVTPARVGVTMNR